MERGLQVSFTYISIVLTFIPLHQYFPFQSANTSNRRILVTRADGSQAVEEVVTYLGFANFHSFDFEVKSNSDCSGEEKRTAVELSVEERAACGLGQVGECYQGRSAQQSQTVARIRHSHEA